LNAYIEAAGVYKIENVWLHADDIRFSVSYNCGKPIVEEFYTTATNSRTARFLDVAGVSKTINLHDESALSVLLGKEVGAIKYHDEEQRQHIGGECIGKIECTVQSVWAVLPEKDVCGIDGWRVTYHSPPVHKAAIKVPDFIPSDVPRLRRFEEAIGCEISFLVPRNIALPDLDSRARARGIVAQWCRAYRRANLGCCTLKRNVSIITAFFWITISGTGRIARDKKSAPWKDKS
ncbi:MAG: hypothetical protein LBP26_05625, partial [Clostridiales bacterium]|nr:hypothetical protein [Clostridiales bacterium]